MKSFVIRFGFISGAISVALMFLTFVLLRGRGCSRAEHM